MLNYATAKKYYKHILWFGEYMLFEYVDGAFVFGVASFTTYDTCLKINDNDNPELAGSKIINAIHNIQSGSFCLMLKPQMFLHQTVQGHLITPQNASYFTAQHECSREYLSMYENMMRLFVNNYILKLFQEPIAYLQQRFDDFVKFHKNMFPQHTQRPSVISSVLMSYPICNSDGGCNRDPRKSTTAKIPTRNMSTCPCELKGSVPNNLVMIPFVREPWRQIGVLCDSASAHLNDICSKMTHTCCARDDVPFFLLSMGSIRNILIDIQKIISEKLCGNFQCLLIEQCNFLKQFTKDMPIDRVGISRLLIVINEIQNNLRIPSTC